MPAIGDQVASLEHDHTEALAKIDSLTATLAAVTSANASLTAENAALNKYADEIKAMVESVASGALNMLKAARAPIVAAVEKVAAEVVADVKPFVEGILGDAPVGDLLVGQEIAPAIVQTDSGDEQPAPQPLAANDATAIGGFERLVAATVPLTVSEHMAVARVFKKDIAAVEAKIADIPDAVERMLHHSSASSAPPVTKIRGPVDMTMIVEHDDGGLPLFLRRGTVFDLEARARLFG